MSAPAASASSTCSRLCASTSIGISWPRRLHAPHRLRDAAGQTHVVVLDQDPVVEAAAMVRAAAGAHGVLLQRAQRRRRLARVEDVMRPPAASTNRRVSVAIPERRCRKLSAVRSAVSIAAAVPRSSATTSPGAQRSPSARCDCEPCSRRIELPERLGGDLEPGDHARATSRGSRRARAAAGGDRRLGRDIAPAEILGERAADDLAVERRDRAARTARVFMRRAPAAARALPSTTSTSKRLGAADSSRSISPAARRSRSTSTQQRQLRRRRSARRRAPRGS